jgi:hypothetical protein
MQQDATLKGKNMIIVLCINQSAVSRKMTASYKKFTFNLCIRNLHNAIPCPYFKLLEIHMIIYN